MLINRDQITDSGRGGTTYAIKLIAFRYLHIVNVPFFRKMACRYFSL